MSILAERDKAILAAELSPDAEVALLARALYREGYDDHDGGHITYRQSDGTFLVTPVERGWNEVRASDVVRIDEAGRKLEGRWEAWPTILVPQLEFHKVRPACEVTLHHHPRYTTVWSALGRVPPAYDKRSAVIPDEEIVLYNEFEGVVEELTAARAVVEAFGEATCVMLRNHGCIVVGDSIAQVFSRAATFEWRCREAWMVEAVGDGAPVPEHGRRSTESTLERDGDSSPWTWIWEWAVRRELGQLEDPLS